MAVSIVRVDLGAAAFVDGRGVCIAVAGLRLSYQFFCADED